MPLSHKKSARLVLWLAGEAVDVYMERSRSYSGNVPSNGSVKIGGLWKRSQGLSRFTRPNYRHRVFILTENALSYYSGTVDRVGQLKGRVALDAITAVEFVQESAFNLPHTFQVVYTTKKSGFVILYVTSTDSIECSDWIATLRQVCYFNKEMMMHYHPGALLRNCWSCCKQTGKTSLGCQPTYHLLTRSSSRYAQMRRKDTLTSSQGSQGRRSKSSSVPREERMSQTPVPGARMEEEGGGSGSGRGLSNSCFDLTRRQIQNSFRASLCVYGRWVSLQQSAVHRALDQHGLHYSHPSLIVRVCHSPRSSPPHTPHGEDRGRGEVTSRRCRGKSGWSQEKQSPDCSRVYSDHSVQTDISLV
ncbi:Ras GTPase-activating protein 2 [Geodia barretti]|uniref:Ras GTPase-activating protein 2 n=1 Tax=Geodia barretti TaxID=519541 RepID=A0AA35RL68_GEOBA|nr:Ras GTPase-activating protein 2 [Geodia barretti]